MNFAISRTKTLLPSAFTRLANQNLSVLSRTPVSRTNSWSLWHKFQSLFETFHKMRFIENTLNIQKRHISFRWWQDNCQSRAIYCFTNLVLHNVMIVDEQNLCSLGSWTRFNSRARYFGRTNQIRCWHKQTNFISRSRAPYLSGN